MIKEVPSCHDYTETGVMYLNLALDSIFDLYLTQDAVLKWNEEIKEYDFPKTLVGDVLTAYRYNMLNAATLVQQGLEMLLKGHITNVSPYLLITSNLKDWPKPIHNTSDVLYSDFKTIDAIDLVSMLSVVTNINVTEQFRQRINESRRRRNKILHSCDAALSVIPLELVKFIIEIAKNLLVDEAFIEKRRKYLRIRETNLLGVFGYGLQLIREGEILLNILTNREKGLYFGVDSTSRWYFCPECAYNYYHHTKEDKTFRTAKLLPNKPESETVRCCVCGESTKVSRVKCDHCEGNVIEEDEHMCMSCGEYVEIEE